MASLTNSRQSVFPLNVVINLRNKIYHSCPPKDEEMFKYEKRLLLRCIHHFKSDLINKMDHMRISATEPSSVILSQTKSIPKVEK